MRILYVEDDDNLAIAVEKMLMHDGHLCDRVRSGAGAVKLGQSNRYDLILLDVMLPDIDGYEVIRLLQGAGINTPVLIQSGLVERDKAMDGLGFGVDDYLIKPFNRDELLSQVRRAAGRSGNVLALPGDGIPNGAAASTTAEAAPEAAASVVIALQDESAVKTVAETAPETIVETTAETAAEVAAETTIKPPLPDPFPGLPAKIVAEESQIDIDCTVISVTGGGAVLHLYDELIECPDKFRLAVARDKTNRCQTCWRHGDKVGVMFL